MEVALQQMSQLRLYGVKVIGTKTIGIKHEVK